MILKKVSVIIPVYNVCQYVGDCLKSVVNQDYQNLEILVVNDGSTDGSLAVCQRYQAQDSRIKILNYHNEGPGAARNNGVECATGEYVTFIDSDDFVDSNYVSELVKQKEKYHSDIAITFNKEYSELDKKFYWMMDPAPGDHKYDGLYSPEKWLKQFAHANSAVSNCAWMKLYDLSLVRQAPFPENVLIEDAHIAWKLALLSRTISFENRATYIYRINRPGAATSSKQASWEYDYYSVLNEKLAVMQETGFDIKYLTDDYRRHLNTVRKAALEVGDSRMAANMKYKLALLQKYDGKVRQNEKSNNYHPGF